MSTPAPDPAPDPDPDPVPQPSSNPRPWVLMFTAVCLIALNMRMTITGVGPLLDDIAADQGVSAAALGMLASIPLITWAVVSPLTHGLAARIGLNAAVSWALIGLALGTVWRSMPGTPLNLWAGTALLGASLAVTNVLIPASVKRDFGTRVPLVMGVYTMLLGATAAVASGMVVPIAHAETASGGQLGWHVALLATGVTIPFALVVWAWATRRRGPYGEPARDRRAESGAPRQRSDVGRRIWSDPTAWWIAIYMGTQSWGFYIYATWLAPIDMSHGADAMLAGLHVTLFHVFGMLASMLSPLMSHPVLRRILPVAIPVLSVIGGTGIVLLPQATPLWLILAGSASGSALSVALTLVAQRTPDTATSTALSGMSQAFGYLIASIGPVLFGWLHEITGDWIAPLVVLLVGVFLQITAGIALRDGHRVFESPRRRR